MGLAVKVEAQVSIEERVARLEADVSHMRTDIAEIKVDLKTLSEKVDARFDGLKDSIAQTKIWMLLMMGGLLGVLARVFHWI